MFASDAEMDICGRSGRNSQRIDAGNNFSPLKVRKDFIYFKNDSKVG